MILIRDKSLFIGDYGQIHRRGTKLNTTKTTENHLDLLKACCQLLSTMLHYVIFINK